MGYVYINIDTNKFKLNKEKMKKYQLQSKIKSVGVAYALFIIILGHYAYVGKWGLQILFWITLGGFGLWAFIDLFRIPSIVAKYNESIYAQIEKIERDEKMHDIAMMKAAVS